MADPDAVAAALARLATGTAGRTGPLRRGTTESELSQPEQSPGRIVADAEAALHRLSTAAAFVDDCGEQRLSRAVSRAAQAGDDAVAERGRDVLLTFDRFRAAANDDGMPPGANGGAPAAVNGDGAPGVAPLDERDRADDHFHPGRATLLTGGGIGSE